MSGIPHKPLPARVARTGKRQVSVQISDEQGTVLERLRQRQRARSWGEVLRGLIDGTGPAAPWRHAVDECNDAHRVLDELGAPKTRRVRRVRGLDGYEDITLGLADRILALRDPAAFDRLVRAARRGGGQ